MQYDISQKRYLNFSDPQAQAYLQLLRSVKEEEARRKYTKFREEVLELFQRGFAPIYQTITKPLWNNTSFARVRRRFYHLDWEEDVAEEYIPIAPDQGRNMSYLRVAVKVVPQLDRETIEELLPSLATPKTRIPGILDSELLVFVAPKLSKNQLQRVKRDFWRGLLRAFRHKPKPGHLTAVIINNSPEICLKRLLSLLANFLQKRLQNFYEAIKIPRYKIPYLIQDVSLSINLNRGSLYSFFNIIGSKLEGYRLTIRQIAKNLSALMGYFKSLLREIREKIGAENLVKVILPQFGRDLTRFYKNLKENKFADSPKLHKKIEYLVEVLIPEALI